VGKLPKRGRVAPSDAREPILARLQVLQRAADRAGCHIESEAINRVVVGLSDAKQKAREARTVVGSDVAAILEELELL
jgi:hypothetical protein